MIGKLFLVGSLGYFRGVLCRKKNRSCHASGLDLFWF